MKLFKNMYITCKKDMLEDGEYLFKKGNGYIVEDNEDIYVASEDGLSVYFETIEEFKEYFS